MKNRIISIGIVGLLVIGGFVGLFMVTDQVNAAGPTYVSGSITSDTIWNLTNSPYIVMGDVTVEPGFTLTIEPGVEVKFDGTYSIIVDGKLIVNGTSTNKIKFTSNQTTPAKGDWYTIRLRTDYNIIDYAEIDYATYGVFITFFGTHNTVSNTTINNCKFDGVYITNSDNNKISNCTITSNDRFGITIYESYGTHVNNCTIQYNNFFGINLNASTHTQIFDCNISYNDGKGILFYSNSHNTTISGCEIDWNNHKGIDLWGTSDNDIINTTVIGNNGVGIDFGGVTKWQWIENCTILDNEGTGIDLRGSSYLDIVGCNVSRNKGKGGIYSASPVECINIINTKVLNNSVGNGIDLYETKWVNITHSDISGNVGNGIYFNESVNHSNNKIQNCTISENDFNGIYFYARNRSSNGNCFIQNNNIYSNTIYSNDQNGIYMFTYYTSCSYMRYNYFYSNIIYSNNKNGIYLYSYRNYYVYLQNNNIYSNDIYLNNQNGIGFLVHTERTYIDNNNIYENSIHANGNNGIYFDSFRDSPHERSYIRDNNIYFNLIFSNNHNGICFYTSVYRDSYFQNNNIYSNKIYQQIGGNSSFNYALDNNALDLTTGGYATWEIDTSTYFYNGCSLKSGKISDSQESYIETLVLGPGTLKFYWKLSTNGGNDYLKFYIDSVYQTLISGSWDWYQLIYEIPSGFHSLKWIYYKDASGSGGFDCGWLDKVEFTGQYLNSGIYLHAEKPTGPWQESHIYNNTILSNSYGIILANMNTHIIYVNNISNNNDGILLFQSTSNDLRYNNITYNNLAGINLTSSSNNNLIENNNISSNNKTGILITDDSNDNLIIRNNITNNLEVGLKITDASGNQIHHNNFINNTQNAYDSTIALNDWDDGAEGNYWSDYLGTDDDNDGFGEDPYVISGGGSRDWHPFIKYVNVTPPYIIFTSPADGEINVPVDTTVSIFFSKEMNTTAVESAISISGGLTPTGFVWDTGNKNVTFTPSSILDMATKYTVTITTDAKDTQGNRIKISYIFTFTTVDIDPPVILLTSPYNGNTNVNRNAAVVVTFNESMQPSSVNYTCFPDPKGWSVSWSNNNTIATFSHNKFGNEATYTFNITTGKDLAGLDLIPGPVPNPWWFSTPDTIGPEITSTSPIYDEENVSITANIVVNFNEEIDIASITYTCMPDPLGWSVAWTNNNKTATFSHNEFTERTWYSFHITGAKDLLGNDLNPGPVPNPWSFTTTGDYIPPQITLTSPVNNTFDVDLGAKVIVIFNEAMDNSSLNYICIPDPGGWSESWSNGNTVVIFSHDPFENATPYTFYINTAKDIAGNNLIQGVVPNPWSFTTVGDLVAPEIISTSPIHNEVDVHPDADIIVTFNEAMDPLSLDYTCTPDPGGWSETWSAGDMIVTFSHTRFEIKTPYIFLITGARDRSGNGLNPGPVPNPWLFTTAGDIIGPQIIITSPIDNEVDIDLAQNIEVTFNETMDNSTLNYLCIPNPGGWSESWSNGNTVVTFSHNPFVIGTIYNFYIIGGKDISGNDLTPGPVPNPWSFSTSGDLIAPEIIYTSPADNEVNVDIHAGITVTFSEEMDIASINYICVPDPGGWSESWSNGDTVVTFSHNSFAINTVYNFYIITGKDVSGNDLIRGLVPNPWSFITIGDLVAPQIISISPVDNKANVDLNTLITITFSEAMDTSTIEFTCSPDPGGWFESWGNGNTVFTLLHNPFEIGTIYTFHITAGKDIAGNNLTSSAIPHSWTFTTIFMASLIVTPSEVNITVNGSVVLIAWAYDSQNNLITDITYTWSVNNNLGTILQQGTQAVTFKASSDTGTCIVNVTVGVKSASAIVTITSEEVEKEEPEDEAPENLLWLWLLIFVIIVLFVINLWLVLRKERQKDEEELESGESVATKETVGENQEMTQDSISEPTSPQTPPIDDLIQPPSTPK